MTTPLIEAAFAAVPREHWTDGPLLACPNDREAAHYLRHVAPLRRPPSGISGVSATHARELMRRRAAVWALLDMGLGQREIARRLDIRPSAVLRAVRAREEACND